MSTMNPATVAGFDLQAAVAFYQNHLASPGHDLGAVLLPSGEWLALAPAACELRDGAREVAQ